MADSIGKPYVVSYPVNETLILVMTGLIITIYVSSSSSTTTPSLTGGIIIPWTSVVSYIAFMGVLMYSTGKALTPALETTRIAMLVILPILVMTIFTGRLGLGGMPKDPRAGAYRTPYIVFFSIGIIVLALSLASIAVLTVPSWFNQLFSGVSALSGILISTTVSLVILISSVMVSQP